MNQFSHRPGFPLQPNTFHDHRIVVYDGVSVGAVTYGDTAHRGRVWHWAAMTEDGYPLDGEVETFDEALEKIKAGVLASMERWPGLLEKKREIQQRALYHFNHKARLRGMPEREI